MHWTVLVACTEKELSMDVEKLIEARDYYYEMFLLYKQKVEVILLKNSIDEKELELELKGLEVFYKEAKE